MKLIVGLGNIGDQYARTRHNIGFMVVNELARRLSATWQTESKFQADISTADTEMGERLILAKPRTMMNLSGVAIQKIAAFYKIEPTDIWVLFDDVDTPFGRLRVRQGGSGSGHQGVISAISYIGNDFARFKVGISLNDRTKESSEVYVLKPFNTAEREQLPTLITAATEVIEARLVEQITDPTTYHLL
jgi:peptidyl-tRNA hydrolase, PTH1 family